MLTSVVDPTDAVITLVSVKQGHCLHVSLLRYAFSPCTAVQSLVKCLVYRDVASDTVCSQARLYLCIELRLAGYF